MRACRQHGQHRAEHTASPRCQEQLLLGGATQGGALGQGLPTSSHPGWHQALGQGGLTLLTSPVCTPAQLQGPKGLSQGCQEMVAMVSTLGELTV